MIHKIFQRFVGTLRKQKNKYILHFNTTIVSEVLMWEYAVTFRAETKHHIV